MTLAPRTELRLRARLALTPGMRAALAWLRMPAEEMAEALEREAADNPFLRVRRPELLGEVYEAALGRTAAGETLMESLARQISTMRIDAATRDAALLLASELRDDGYLGATLAEIAGDYAIDTARLGAGLAALQACDPPGIGARDLAECLALKLRDNGFSAAEAQGLVAGIEALVAGRTGPLARRLGLTEARCEQAVRLLRGFSPVPVESGAGDPLAVRLPEIVVEPDGEGRLAVRLNDTVFPEVTLADDIAAARAGSDRLAALGRRADGIVRAVRSRGETLLRIGRHIAGRQAAFFLDGQRSLVPESRAEAAAALGLHPSTLGRAVAGKALLAGAAVVPLDRFFGQALPGADGPVSAFDVQRRIRELVQAEPEGAPLSDEDLRQRLAGEGVDIARRTVAKYRKCLRIASSFERRRRRARP